MKKRASAAEKRTATRRTTAGPARSRPPVAPGVKVKIWLTLGPRTLFGEGKADLLEAVDRLGSLRSAANSIGMSYRHAWGLLRELDAAAGFAFLEHSGRGPRSSLRLTAEGRRFIDRYRRLRTSVDAALQKSFRFILTH